MKWCYKKEELTEEQNAKALKNGSIKINGVPYYVVGYNGNTLFQRLLSEGENYLLVYYRLSVVAKWIGCEEIIKISKKANKIDNFKEAAEKYFNPPFLVVRREYIKKSKEKHKKK